MLVLAVRPRGLLSLARRGCNRSGSHSGSGEDVRTRPTRIVKSYPLAANTGSIRSIRSENGMAKAETMKDLGLT